VTTQMLNDLNPRVWRRRASDGAQYMNPPLDFHPSDDENEEAFRRSRLTHAYPPEYSLPQRLRRAAPNARKAECPFSVPPIDQDQVPPRGP
jgi:hypothetical protein